MCAFNFASSYNIEHGVLFAWRIFHRLGIGATVPKESKFTHSNNPIERKLLAKLHNDKRNTAKKHEDLATSAKDENADEDSEEDESESKTRAFGKKRPPASISHRQMKKRRR
ncbi:hypothetical protein ACS0TY_019841 [Phlomoides rotata]